MSHEQYRGMLELAALDALEEAELRLLEKHLEMCSECREELTELRDAAASLIHLASPVPAPTGLRTRVLEAIKAPGMNRASELDATDDEDEAERTTYEPPS